MAVEIKELIIRALVGRDDDDGQGKTEEDQKTAQKSQQANVSQDTIAMVTDMLNKQKER
jgi:hypothetical protein